MHLVVKSYVKGRPVEIIGIDDEFQAGDVCWLETPLNPTGEARSVSVFSITTRSLLLAVNIAVS